MVEEFRIRDRGKDAKLTVVGGGRILDPDQIDQAAFMSTDSTWVFNVSWVLPSTRRESHQRFTLTSPSLGCFFFLGDSKKI